VVLFGVVFASDVVFGPFPLGCGIESLWAGCVFQTDVYGFPNSAASYYVLLLGTLIVGAVGNQWRRFLMAFVFPIGIVLIALTLSRAAWLYLLWLIMVGWFFVLSRRLKFYSLLVLLVVIVANVFLIPSYGDIDLFLGILQKIKRTMDDDPSSGRIDIWIEAFSLIVERPILGYHFDFFRIMLMVLIHLITNTLNSLSRRDF
jgi:O-antigen ligase